MVQNRASWNVKDEAIIEELVTLMDVTSGEAQLLAGLADAAKAAAPAMTDAFYQRLLRHDNTKEYFEGITEDRMHSMLGTWFVELFGGTYDAAYAKRRMVIGQVHVTIGLPLRYPLAMMDVILEFGEQIARSSAKPDEAVVAFRKVMALDVAIFNQAYEDNQIRHLAELVGGERLARLLLSGGG